MIVDLLRFAEEGRPYWRELEAFLARLELNPGLRMSLDEARRFHYCYERVSADLGKVITFASEPELRRYLESLVGRAYGEIHDTRERRWSYSPWRWLTRTFPKTFRRNIHAFQLALAVTVAGCAFGAVAIVFDPDAKSVMLPFPHLQQHPSERVASEEAAEEDQLSGVKMRFSAMLMTHNTRVSILMLALGMSWGVGTIILLFYNGVILGAVAADYVMAGESTFLTGWLLPHGSIEIPAILIAGQAGLILGRALIGEKRRATMARRLREAAPDVVTLIAGVAILLIWAGVIESFFSQYHEPFMPYELKIAFGVAELLALIAFLWKAGSKVEV